jgi:hypothetical protein
MEFFNLLEPSGPVQACNGIALPLPLHGILKNVDFTLLTKYLSVADNAGDAILLHVSASK